MRARGKFQYMTQFNGCRSIALLNTFGKDAQHFSHELGSASILFFLPKLSVYEGTPSRMIAHHAGRVQLWWHCAIIGGFPGGPVWCVKAFASMVLTMFVNNMLGGL
jgi:hypothetical protein